MTCKRALGEELRKGFRVLEVFEGDGPKLTLSEIAARAGLDAGTTSRLVKTLVMLGYLEAVAVRKRYRLSLLIPYKVAEVAG